MEPAVDLAKEIDCIEAAIFMSNSCVFMRRVRAREFLLSHLLEMVQFFPRFFSLFVCFLSSERRRDF